VPQDVQVFSPKPKLFVFLELIKKGYQIAAELQSLKFPDAYKGKGLKFTHIPVSFKEGKEKIISVIWFFYFKKN
jgi:ribosomal protein L6P/L9E